MLVLIVKRKRNMLILTDCDGVLLDWEVSFDIWMASEGYQVHVQGGYDMAEKYGISKPESKKLVREFNESEAMGNLPPLRDAVEYVKRIYLEKGCRFRVITSLSLDPVAGALRRRNLAALFGSAIESVICLDTGADKEKALEPYLDSGMMWIEDKVENAELGAKMGLHAILMKHSYNQHYDGKEPLTLVKSWKEIYEML
jgi:hypothetical protein